MGFKCLTLVNLWLILKGEKKECSWSDLKYVSEESLSAFIKSNLGEFSPRVFDKLDVL
jgi:hypothetical protein